MALNAREPAANASVGKAARRCRCAREVLRRSTELRHLDLYRDRDGLAADRHDAHVWRSDARRSRRGDARCGRRGRERPRPFATHRRCEGPAQLAVGFDRLVRIEQMQIGGETVPARWRGEGLKS